MRTRLRRPRRAALAVARAGYEVQLLRLAMESAGASVVRLGYALKAGSWVALDDRG